MAPHFSSKNRSALETNGTTHIASASCVEGEVDEEQSVRTIPIGNFGRHETGQLSPLHLAVAFDVNNVEYKYMKVKTYGTSH